MTLAVGARLGPYEILSLIGAGGMGEVYKGRDSRLDRIVAIKLLHPDLAARADRRARFEAEARAISSLNHPHICSLFDVGDEDGRAFLVMEYLDGQTLEDRLTRGALPPSELLPCALQIAGALEHAHAENIVHRDMKPSNVMLTPTGVKLLDFGLARQPVAEGVAPASTLSLDQRRLTAEGTLVGTFHYMAPEQLEGMRADHRTDIFAFGAVLYEMATGRRAFEGGSQASLIASILTGQPPAIAASGRRASESMLALDHVVERCLAKHPDHRWQTMQDVKLELEWIAKGAPENAARVRRKNIRLREAAAWLLAVIGATVAGLVYYGSLDRRLPDTTRFVVAPPPGVTIGIAENRTRLAMAPDGRRLAFIGTKDGRQQIWIHSLDSLTAVPLAGTDGAVSPFWSPDGRFVGFFSTAEGEIKKIAISGGPALTICAAQMDGAPVWGGDGTILFTQFPGGGIHRVSAAGGTPAAVTTIVKAKRELNHYWPEFLPDGRHFLYMATALDASGTRATPTVYIAALNAAETRPLTRMHSRMAAGPPGYVLFVQDGTILAQQLDLASFQLRGEPIRIVDGAGYFRTLGNGAFSLSGNGALGYLGNSTPVTLTWYDRHGVSTNPGWDAQNFGTLRLSPDGGRIIADVSDPAVGTADLWVYQADRGAPVRLTTDLTNESQPTWSPDGQRVLFRWERGGSPNLYAKAVASGVEELLVADPSPLTPEDWSTDGKWVAYVKNTRRTSLDLWLMPLDGERTPRTFSAERFDEWGARFSPNSRWMAFASTESGSPEIYIAPIGAPGDRRRISVGGGSSPRWRRDGRELFYVTADNRAVMAVPVDAGTALTGAPVRLFSLGSSVAARDRARNVIYDVAPDGQRFLVGIAAADPSTSRITVVLNWASALTR